jgi:hypothetical protein
LAPTLATAIGPPTGIALAALLVFGAVVYESELQSQGPR